MAATDARPLIELRGVQRDYLLGGQTVTAVDRLDLTIDAGSFCAVVGPSGSGKSTLLNLLGLLDRPSSGSYRLAGVDTESLSERERARLRNQAIGFVFQQFRLLPRLSVLDNVCLPYLYGDWDRDTLRARGREWLERLGLAARLAHRPEQLSGGERQRVALARALVTEPAVLLADEPTGALDSANGRLIMELMHEIHRSASVTIVMITHDEALAASCPTRLQMRDGRLIAA